MLRHDGEPIRPFVGWFSLLGTVGPFIKNEVTIFFSSLSERST